MTVVDMSTVDPVSEMAGDHEEDTKGLQELLARAEAYLLSFKWCHGIKEAYFGDGVGHVIAVFLFRIDGDAHVDEWLCVVTGDMPSCYMVTDDISTPDEALEGYCGLMLDWIEAVRSGESLDDVYPVEAPATEENADALASRMQYLQDHIIPWFREGTVSRQAAAREK